METEDKPVLPVSLRSFFLYQQIIYTFKTVNGSNNEQSET